jgi:ABC-2 type transport system ATP-binding protein
MEFHGVLYKVPDMILGKKIEELLNFVELWDRKNDIVKHFSGGMKRRLEIARGLLHTPEVLFMDEPTIDLDPQTRNHIWKYLKDLNGTAGITVFSPHIIWTKPNALQTAWRSLIMEGSWQKEAPKNS